MVTTDGHNSAFYLTNAIELLGGPGSGIDIRSHKLYYYPRQGKTWQKAAAWYPQ